MNKEIKEILDFKENADYKKLSCDEISILKDYITNLQEKIKHYEETTTFGDYVKEVNLLVDYKSRIEKAVEYIEKHRKIYKLGVNQETDEFDYISTSPQVLLNILNGRSDE